MNGADGGEISVPASHELTDIQTLTRIDRNKAIFSRGLVAYSVCIDLRSIHLILVDVEAEQRCH